MKLRQKNYFQSSQVSVSLKTQYLWSSYKRLVVWVDQKGANKEIIAWLGDLKDEQRVLTKAWKKEKRKSNVKEIGYYFFLFFWFLTKHPIEEADLYSNKESFLAKNVEVATFFSAKLRKNYENTTCLLGPSIVLQRSVATWWKSLNSGRSGF